MVKCDECGTQFDVSDARDEYNDEFGNDPGITYDEDFVGTTCASCAISQTQSNINHGTAILMMSGDEDYDEDHVEKYL